MDPYRKHPVIRHSRSTIHEHTLIYSLPVCICRVQEKQKRREEKKRRREEGASSVSRLVVLLAYMYDA